MELFLIRHGIAEDRSGRQPDDARALTPKGSKRFAREVEGLATFGIAFDRVYSSPWKRALETAELLAPLLDGERIALKELAARPSSALLGRLEGEHVAAVGHQPWLGQLAGWLAFGEAAAGESLELKKGGVIWLSGKPRPGAMELVAMLPPKLLRKLA